MKITKLIWMLFSFIFLSCSQVAFAQTEGCLFLEGLKLPCFGGGVACGSCSNQYTQEQRDQACIGTLPLNNPPGCAQGKTCGTKCCSSCSQYDPDKYYECQDLPKACDANGQPTSCGKGTKKPSCDDPDCVAKADYQCGSFTCTPCKIICQGKAPPIDCYAWTKKSVPSGSCSCPNVGANPGQCNGSPTGASECGGSTTPCGGGSESACLGKSNRCWTCTWDPGQVGTVMPKCNTGTSYCYENPVKSTKCGIYNPITHDWVCPSGETRSDTRSDMCGGAGSTPQCTKDSDCSCN